MHLLGRLMRHDYINFLLSNRIPRVAATRFMGWFSRIENPLICAASLRLWRCFADIDLSDAKKTRFTSMHDCFTRELVDGARSIDPDPRVLVSPCDGIVGASGVVQRGMAVQAKGFLYPIEELLADAGLAAQFEHGRFVTIRITAAMYHRFHAPGDCIVDEVCYVPGDAWNVNPPALGRVERLFCRNERAILRCTLRPGGTPLVMVPVAAILVAGIRLHFLELVMNLGYRGAKRIGCAATLARGQEMGWFEHGSTIILFVPAGFAPAPGLQEGQRVRVGQALLQIRAPGRSALAEPPARSARA